MRHRNPYRINDPSNWLEVTANSSHHELKDARRIWKFYAYTFTSETEIAKFFEQEGLDIKDYSYNPEIHKDNYNGKNLIIINVVPKSQSLNQRRLRSMTA